VYKVRGSRVLTVGIVGALVFAGVAAIAASLDVSGVEKLGSGSKPVTCPVNASNIEYNFDGDASTVDSVNVTLTEKVANSIPADKHFSGTVYVTAYHKTDSTYSVLGQGSSSFTFDASKDGSVESTTVSNISLGVSSEGMDKIAVTVEGNIVAD